MIKGVNRQVVEVAETGSDYFEKALFFVNPKYYGLSDGKLREKAQSLMTAAGTPPKCRNEPKKKSKLKTAIGILVPAVLGSVLTIIINAII